MDFQQIRTTLLTMNIKKLPGRVRVDWAAVQRDYRTGAFTLRELATKYGCSHVAIGKQAKNNGWTQDLSKAIKAATKAKLVEVTPADKLAAKQVIVNDFAVTTTVLAAAEVNKQIILGHRADLRKARDVTVALLAELRNAAITEEEQERLIRMMAGDGADPSDLHEARKLLMRFTSLAGRITSVKSMAEALTKLQAAERKAFGLDDEGDEAKKPELVEQLAVFIAGIHESGSGRLPIAPQRIRAQP